MPTRYTQVPRAVMWLIKGDDAVLGPDDAVYTREIGSFYVSKGCVSNLEFEAFRPEFTRGQHAPGDDDPAVGIGFRDALAYADWYAMLSKKSFRLLTEAEWEFAAREQGRSRYPWGDAPEDADEFAWTAENSGGRPHPVHSPKVSRGGLFSMIGNVWEWTSSEQPPPSAQSGDGPDEPGGLRIIRGGGFRDPVQGLGCARREAVVEATKRDDLGFRICRSL